jgi:hypothetical protein
MGSARSGFWGANGSTAPAVKANHPPSINAINGATEEDAGVEISASQLLNAID